VAEIARRGPVLAPVPDVKFAPTPSTPEQARHEAEPCPDGPRSLIAVLAQAVATQSLLMFLVHRPLNIAFVVIGDEDPRLRERSQPPLPSAQPPIDETDLDRAATVDVGPGVDGVVQDIPDEAEGGKLEHQLDAAVAGAVHRQLDALVGEPLEGLSGAPRLPERLEDEGDGFLHPQVGILHDLAAAVGDIARRQDADQLSALGLGLHPRQEPLLQDLEFDDAERAFDPEDQLVIEEIHIVDVFVVTDERVEDPAQLEQVAPVRVGAREARELAAEDDADLAEGHRGQQVLEAIAWGRAQGGAPAQVRVDDVDLSPAKRAGPIRQGVLQALALEVLLHLALRGLPQIHDGGAG